MKKIISLLILLILLLVLCELGTTFFKKGHEITYQVIKNNQTFEVVESYHKDYYDVVVTDNQNNFYYTFSNLFNKQKKIVEDIYSYQEDDNYCVYLVLSNNQKSYIECVKDGNHYLETTYPDSKFISVIKEDLLNKQIITIEKDSMQTENLGQSVVYKNNLLPNDTVVFWDYKGIQIIHPNKLSSNNLIGFDKYDNQHGALVGDYYLIPLYTSSKVFEFNKLKSFNIDTLKMKVIDLNHMLSSGTYINGVIDNKLYYMDPSNLIQMEINPKKESSRLIGDKDLGGQNYQGTWQNINIYDLAADKIKFTEKILEDLKNKYDYEELIEAESSYYYYDSVGKIYQIPKNHLEQKILLAKENNLSNFTVVGDNIYYVVEDSLYCFDSILGIHPILKNNELRYNKNNRIDVRRKY